ncbi:hypothetical protein JEZ13_09845 [bacterium]|nr:hypothetical protein [bacterium]
MKQRFITLNSVIIILFTLLLLAHINYFKLKDLAIGETAINELNLRENENLQKLTSIKFTVYNTRTNDLNQIRNDIMAIFQESDFSSITILPKAAFIDSLLHDSKLKDYISNTNFTKYNQSLINKMKLYSPNELLISFLPKKQTIDQIHSINEYLQDNGYILISDGNIPAIKSDIKHYYFNKAMFEELEGELSELTGKKYNLQGFKASNRIIEIAFLIVIMIFASIFVQLLDYYLLKANLERFKFLLKGHINPRKYLKTVILLKSISLALIFLCSILWLIRGLLVKNNSLIEPFFVVLLAFTALVNIVVYVIKKEKVNL